MHEVECNYCTENARLHELMTLVGRYEYATVYMFHDQTHPGRCVVAANEHVTELFELDDPVLCGFWQTIRTVAQCLHRLFQPGKINYAVYGDIQKHLHVHVVPKMVEGVGWGEPFDVLPPNPVFLESTAFRRRVDMVTKAIEETLL